MHYALVMSGIRPMVVELGHGFATNLLLKKAILFLNRKWVIGVFDPLLSFFFLFKSYRSLLNYFFLLTTDSIE